MALGILNITKNTTDVSVVLRLEGRFTSPTVPDFDAALSDSATGALTIDLSGLQSIDSAALDALVRSYRAASARKQGFRLVGIAGPVLRTFQLFNLTRLFDLRPSRENPEVWEQLHRAPVWDDHRFMERLLAGLGEGVVGLDTEERILFADKASRRILHLGEDDPTDRPFCSLAAGWQLIEGERLAPGALLTHHLEENDGIFRFEMQLAGAPAPVWVAAVAIGVRRDDTPTGILVALTDITPEREQDRALRDERLRYAQLIGQVRDGLIVLDESGRIAHANQRLLQILKREQEDLAGRRPDELLLPADRKRLRELAMMRGREGARAERIDWLSGQDEPVHTLTSMSPFLDASQKPRGQFIVVTDVTDYERARNELAENENRYRQMVEAVTSYSYTIDVRNGQTVATSYGQGCEEVTGYSAEEFESNPLLFFGIIHDDDKDAAVRYVQRILAGERVAPCVFRIHHRNGETRWIRSTAVLTFDSRREVVRYDVLVEDISRERRMEEELRQAQKMEALGRLAGGVAHDFNNLLTAILGNLTLIEMECTEKQKRRVADAQKAGQRATNLVRQLLTFSRKTRAVMETVRIEDIVAEVADIARKTFDKRIDIAWQHPDKPLGNIRADAGQMHQVLLNLCLNARDSLLEALRRDTSARLLLSIEAREIEVDMEECRRNPLAAPGHHVEVSISDTGIGMDRAVRERIFDPFFTTKEEQGTGLGLASAFGIVRQHHGWITVKSEPDVGACFQFFLPVVDTAEQQAPAEAPAETDDDLPRGDETVLLVDDEPMVRSLVEASLERLGYSVLLAKDGLDGLRTFFRHRDTIDLTILDISMPVLAGTEVLRQIRSVEPQARVILTSGYATEESVRRDGNNRENAFLPKPFRPTDLAYMVREVLDE